MSHLQTIQNHDREYDVLIIGGLGHVGLPLGIVLAQAGARVCLYDINAEAAQRVQAGEMPFIEYGSEDVLKEVLASGNLTISLDKEDVRNAKFIIITIGTPVDEYLGPKVRLFMDSIASLEEYLDLDQVLIVRSTVFPRTCQHIASYLNEKKGPWHIAYCPERITQGYAMTELKELPQLIAGMTPEAGEMAEALFSLIAPKILHVSIDEAELAKLFTNAWRYIQFAAANQFYMIADDYGVDFNKLRHIMKDGYDRLISLPGAGFAAGPCLLKDTMQLSGTSSNNFSLGQAAMHVNENLPNFLIEKIRVKHSLDGKCVGILGMAFKSDIDDTRDSLSFKLKNLLRFHGAKVLCSDEFCDQEGMITKEEMFEKAEVIVVGVPHSAYKEVTIPSHIDVIDLWGVIDSGAKVANESAQQTAV